MRIAAFLKRPITVLAGLCLWTGAASASDDFQYWSRATLKAWEEDRWSFSTYGDMRLMNDAGDVRLYLASGRLSYRWFDHLDLGANYTAISSKTLNSMGEDEFKYQHRAEFEANPHWNFAEWLEINNRNRMEFRWIEDQGSDHPRFRQKWEAAFPLKDASPFTAVYADGEYFYDFNQERINENRVTPIGLDITINGRVGLKFFYMIQFRRGEADWSSNQIFGSHLVIEL